MSMYDTILFQGKEYQTRSTPIQFMNTYEIRDQQLWWRKTEYEWVGNEDHWLGGYLEEISYEWVFCDTFDGVIDFYREDVENGGYKNNAWIEYHSLFNNGELIKIELCCKKTTDTLDKND